MKRSIVALGALLFVFSLSERSNALTNKIVDGPEDAVVLDRSCVLYWQADKQLGLFCAIFYHQNGESFIQITRGYNPTKSQGLLHGVNWMQLEIWSAMDLGGRNTIIDPRFDGWRHDRTETEIDFCCLKKNLSK